VIRHSVVMLLVYVVADRQRRMADRHHPSGLYPGAGSRVTSSSPCNCPARRRWRVRPTWSGRLKESRSIPRVSFASRCFAGFSGATRTQAGNAAGLVPAVFDEPDVRLKKGLSATAITGELRKRLAALQGAFIIVIPPPAVPGIGTGGELHDAHSGSPGSRP